MALTDSSNNYIFIAAASGGIVIYDLSNKKIINTYNFPSQYIYIRDSYLYSAGLSNGITIFDISDPKNTQLINKYQFEFLVESIYVEKSSKYAFVGS